MSILNFLADLDAKIPTDKINNLPTSSANNVLSGGLNAVYFIAGIVAVVVIVVAGYFFVTSTGEPEKVAKARNTILYAVIGLVVIISAFVITQFVLGRF